MEMLRDAGALQYGQRHAVTIAARQSCGVLRCPEVTANELAPSPAECRGGRYIHSKGVYRDMRQPKERTAVYLWRYVMEYHLIALWRDCLELLETHDAVGERIGPSARVHV